MNHAEYCIFVDEILEYSRTAVVKTADRCAEVEEKLAETIKLQASFLKEFPDKEKSMVYLKFEAIKRALKKAVLSFTSIAESLEKRKEDLEQARRANTQKLAERKQEIVATALKTAKVAFPVPAVVAVPAQAKRGRPKKGGK